MTQWYAEVLRHRYSDEDWETARKRYAEYCRELIKEGYKGDFILDFESTISTYDSAFWIQFFKGLKKKPYE